LYYFGRDNLKFSHWNVVNYKLLSSNLPDWLADSFSRWLGSLEVFEFSLWYFIFWILCCDMFRKSWLNQISFTVCETYYSIKANWPRDIQRGRGKLSNSLC